MKAPGIVRWYGGKGNLREKILPLIPPGGRPYCEPFAGAASILFARKPAPIEVLNDLHNDLINLYRCFQDREKFEELKHRLSYTLYSRAELGRALEILNSDERDPILRAWAFYVASNMSMSGVIGTIGNWSRTFRERKGEQGSENAVAFSKKKRWFDVWHHRLQKIQIDNRDALEVIRYWDNPEAVFYLDPPYHLETRKGRKAYRHEASDDFHVRLVETILQCRGAVVLSGYDHPVYQPLTDRGWEKIVFEVSCHATPPLRTVDCEEGPEERPPRQEIVWRNPQAVEKCQGGVKRQGLVF
jgi:DNA adenine methylase